MFIRTLILLFTILFFIGEIIAQAPAVSICNYLDNKKAAVSITFDDGCKDQFLIGQPIMDNMGFEGTFFIISDYTPATGFGYGCSYDLTWTHLQNAINHGHEIGSHTLHHTLLGSLYLQYGADTVESELRKSRDSLNKHLNGQKVLTFAYPEGSGGDDSPVSDQIRKLLHKYYIGARVAGSGPLGYDTYPYATGGGFNDFYFQVESVIIYDTTSLYNYTQKLDGAIQDGGWFVPMYHRFNENDPLSITTANFTNHMNAIKERRNSLWIAPFKDILKYHKEKTASTVSITTSPAQMVVVLTDTITNQEFDMSLTLLVTNLASDCHIDSIKQGTRRIQFKMVGNNLQFNAMPDRGNITIFKSTLIYTAPVLTSLSPSSITSSSVSMGGNVTNDGNAAVTARGVCWSTSANPTIFNSKTSDGAGEGSFVSSITNLTAGSTYYARAYATNSVGTGYGNEVSFTTLLSTGIVDNFFLNNISIYPNPSTGLFYLSFQSYHSPLSELKIISAEGRVVYKENLNQFMGDYFREIDMKGLLNGIYCIEITTEKNRIIRKMVVQ